MLPFDYVQLASFRRAQANRQAIPLQMYAAEMADTSQRISLLENEIRLQSESQQHERDIATQRVRLPFFS